MAYKGRYKVQNIGKYHGDADKVVYRSLWELHTFKWMDHNPDVEKWNSEELVIPYTCKTDNRGHRYFPDILAKFKNGKVLLIEIKPHHQTVPPSGKTKTSRMLNETLTYAKNISKWEAATKYCNERGWVFQIWDEHTLESIGIKLLSRKNPKGKAKRING
jgi:hypothetical protein